MSKEQEANSCSTVNVLKKLVNWISEILNYSLFWRLSALIVDVVAAHLVYIAVLLIFEIFYNYARYIDYKDVMTLCYRNQYMNDEK